MSMSNLDNVFTTASDYRAYQAALHFLGWFFSISRSCSYDSRVPCDLPRRSLRSGLLFLGQISAANDPSARDFQTTGMYVRMYVCIQIFFHWTPTKYSNDEQDFSICMYVCMCILLSFTIVHLYLTYMYLCINAGGASLSGIRATAERLRSPMPIYGEAFRGN